MLAVAVIGGQGLAPFLFERRLNKAKAEQLENQADVSAVKVATDMMRHLHAELQRERRMVSVLFGHIKDLRRDMLNAGLEVTPIPDELKELGL